MEDIKYTRFDEIPEFTRSSGYRVHIPWTSIERQLQEFETFGKLELEPDFQRAHVWDDAKRTRFVEYVLRNGRSSRVLYWNCPEFGQNTGPERGKIVLVDGLQRLTAARKFLRNEVPAFGTYYGDYESTLSILTAYFEFHVNDLPTRAEVLQWYLDLNEGGVVHTTEELDKVRELLKQTK